MAVLELAVGLSFVVMILSLVVLRWNELMYRKKGLPPGTMGWPLVGETNEFLNQGPIFMNNQRARYGNLFKTHILGCPTVICTDPELNRSILINEGRGLVPGYPQSMCDILGESNIAAVHGSLHKAMRRALLGLVHPPIIRDHLLPKIDEFMRSHISNWNDEIIDIQEKTNEIWLLSVLKLLIGIETGPVYETLRSEIYKLVVGTISLPINLPGTNYHSGFQARKKIIGILKELIHERRTSPTTCDDMLNVILKNDDDNKTNLTDDQLIDLIITLIYSGYETVSRTSMMATKFLHDHPTALQELRDEHFKIRAQKSAEDPISWNDYRLMTFTRAVILETLRIANVVNGVLRKTSEDLEMKGYLIPKGWRIYVYTRETNFDKFLYPEPLAFNPWRWRNNNLESHRYFLAFGGGSRLCPGKELGMVEVATFLHYFVTRYRWREKGGDKILKFPRVEAPNGLHIQIWNYD